MKRCGHCGEDNLDDARFCDQCGAPFEVTRKPPTINVNAPPGLIVSVITGKGFELLPDREMLIGRGDSARGIKPDVHLSDHAAISNGVSRVHAKIFCEENVYYIADLNSTNSTFLNDIRVDPQKPQRLKNGDIIKLGRYPLKVTLI